MLPISIVAINLDGFWVIIDNTLGINPDLFFSISKFNLLEETYARFYSPQSLKKIFVKSGFHSRYVTGLMGSVVIMLGSKLPLEPGKKSVDFDISEH